MKIIVIGNSARVRSEIVQRLRDQGHEAATPSALPVRTHAGTRSVAPRDPGHAGRHLRQLLERTGEWLLCLRQASRIRGRQGLSPIGRLEDGSP